MKTLLKLVVMVSVITTTHGALPIGTAQAQVKEQRTPGRGFQRMSKFKSYDECLRHNLKGMAGDTRRASKWCSRQGYTQ
jgi:hypothetical protein